jgi:hypothetical protein
MKSLLQPAEQTTWAWPTSPHWFDGFRSSRAPAEVDNSTYYAVVRDDLIYAAFEHRLATSPEDFDAVTVEEPPT